MSPYREPDVPTPPPGPKVCPRCRTINPPSSERCDCSYDFTTGVRDPVVEKQRRLEREIHGSHFAAFAMLFCLLVLISIVSAIATERPVFAFPSLPLMYFMARSYSRWRRSR